MTVAIAPQRKNGGEAEAARQAAFDNVKHQRLLIAARNVTIQWRRQPDGSFLIPPGARLALLAAVDDSWDALKGVME